MPLVNRSETPDVQWPEWKSETAPVAPPPPPQKNEVEALSPALANGDSWSESKLRDAFSTLHEGDAFEVSGKLLAKAEEGGSGAAKLRAEREEDGALKLTVTGEGAFHAGKGFAKVAAGTTFRFPAGREAEAADLADALVKGAVVTAAPLGTQSLASLAVNGTMPGALAERIDGYSDRVSSVKVDAGVALHVGHDSKMASGFESWDFGKLKAEAEATEGFAINFDKGTFTVNRTVGIEGDGSVNVPVAFKAGVKGGASATLSAEYEMPESMKRALADGTMSAAEAWGKLSSRSVPDKLIARVEIESTEKGIGGPAGISTKTKAEAEVELDVAGFLKNPQPGKVLEDLAHAKWTVETESGGGAAFAASGGVDDIKGSVEFSALRTHKWTMEGLPFAEAAKRLEHHDDDQQLLDARRAIAR